MASDDPLVVQRNLIIPAAELSWSFGPSGGPGGQHANTANTRAELVFEIGDSPTLTPSQRDKLDRVFGPRVRVVADDTRSQSRNRDIALERLREKLVEALKPTRTRRPTRPTRGSKERRLKNKKARGRRKAGRSRNWDHD